MHKYILITGLLLAVLLLGKPALAADAKRVEINGASIAYTEQGEGQPLLLLHGGGLSSAMWGNLAGELAKHYRVVMPDTRGHGASTNPKHEFGYRLLADDMVKFCQALELKDPYVLGFSDGGAIAMTMGVFHPGAAKAYIFGGISTLGSKAAMEQYRKGMGYFYAPVQPKNAPLTDADLDAMYKAAPESWDFIGKLHAKPGEPDYWRTLMKDVWITWNNPQDYAYSAEQMAKITVPALVLLGDRDEFFSLDGAVRTYLDLPAGELAVIPNGVHGAFRSQRDLFLANVLNFLGRVNGGDKGKAE